MYKINSAIDKIRNVKFESGIDSIKSTSLSSFTGGWRPQVPLRAWYQVRVGTQAEPLTSSKIWQKQFAVTGDETWVHYFEPVRKVSNKIWVNKMSRSPIITKRPLSAKNVLYIILFFEGVAIEVRKVLQRRSTEETEKVLSGTTPCHWF